MVTINIGSPYPRRRRRYARRTRPQYRSFGARRYESRHDSGDTSGSGGVPPARPGYGWNPIKGYFPLRGGHPDHMKAASAGAFFGGGFTGNFQGGFITTYGAIV